MRDPRERLRDILDAIAAIERYDRRDKATFGRDELFQVRFSRHLRIIGEAARALPEEVRALSSDIRWPSHAKPHPWHHRLRRGIGQPRGVPLRTRYPQRRIAEPHPRIHRDKPGAMGVWPGEPGNDGTRAGALGWTVSHGAEIAPNATRLQEKRSNTLEIVH